MVYKRPRLNEPVTSLRAGTRPKNLLMLCSEIAKSAGLGAVLSGSSIRSLGDAGALCRRCGGLLLLGSVLRGALGLKMFGLEDAIAPQRAFGQRLCVVFECIRGRFTSVIDHG